MTGNRAKGPGFAARLLGALVLAAAAVVGIGRSVGIIGADHAAQSTAIKRVTMDAMWAEGFQSLSDMKRHADLVILGTVGGVVGHSEDRGLDPNAVGIPFTDFSVDVQQVLWNPHGIDTSVPPILHQTGGMVNGTEFANDDDPLFQQGEQSILFLHQFAPGYFNVLGGPEGRFRVVDGKVDVVSTTHIPAFHGPEDLQSFIASVKQA